MRDTPAGRGSTLPCNAMVGDRLGLLHEVADAVTAVLRRVENWGESGLRTGQYLADLDADDAALGVLRRAGVGVLSEESGLEGGDRAEVVVLDPLDGSTNASRGVPWFATALCLVDRDGPATALVVDQASGVRWWAERGSGAFRDGDRIGPSGCADASRAIIGVSGRPVDGLPYAQFRALGAAALDLCLVASGTLDGFVDCVADAHGVWDYLASTLICREAGAAVVDALGRDLVVLDHAARRTPVAAATPALLDTLVAARRAATNG
jgi:myo-inositol-1(or 4)-monophosphatase